ncbi:hypothetical protein [Sediminitomix flava]|uniref:DUF4384 domain-containing protein n=1 Tax=Sediminitomix flava TaxID=379075 RepID=A0A315Z7M3_SEDFL|nr:hypothetical protein [Sediminitomix flava]PWJ40154.1 hypothetical protein BC781_105222 [Sediminitomix flava]
MPLKLILITVFLHFFFVESSFSQKTKIVSSKIIRAIEDEHHIGQLKENMLQKAKSEAMAKAFGTNVQQHTHYQIQAKGDSEFREDHKLTQSTNSEVKGEWVKTIKKSFEWLVEVEGQRKVLYLVCEVKGKAREINTQKVDFTLETLKCPKKEQCISNQFFDGDHLYLNYKSPKKGHLTIFYKEGETVYQLFPYQKMKGENGEVPVLNANKDYLLFDLNSAKDFQVSSHQVDEIGLELSSSTQELHKVYAIFSERPYALPLSTQKNGIPVLEYDSFQKWIEKNKMLSSDFQELVKFLTLSPKR